MNAIVIGDDRARAEFVKACLLTRWPSAQVAVVGTSHFAPTVASGAVPDVVFLDFVLPETRDLEILERIRDKSDVPLIIMAADTIFSLLEASEDVRQISLGRRVALGLHAGADGYITVPVEADEFVARVGAVLRRTSRLRLNPPAGREGPPGHYPGRPFSCHAMARSAD